MSTECIRNPLEWMYYQSDSVQLKDIHNKFGEEELKSFPITSILNHKIFLPYFRGIRVRKPLDLMDYDKKEAMNLLKEKFDWILYPQNILNQDLQDFMKVIGYLEGLDMILGKFNFRA